MLNPEILGQEVISESGSFQRVRQYIQGHHPKLGKLHHGWSGPETVVEKDLIRPVASVRITPTLPKGRERLGKSFSGSMAEKRQALWQ